MHIVLRSAQWICSCCALHGVLQEQGCQFGFMEDFEILVVFALLFLQILKFRMCFNALLFLIENIRQNLAFSQSKRCEPEKAFYELHVHCNSLIFWKKSTTFQGANVHGDFGAKFLSETYSCLSKSQNGEDDESRARTLEKRCWVAVAYAENFHGGVHSVAYGSHL